jgi:hypothetical protein
MTNKGRIEMWQVRRALAEVAKRLNARNLMRLYAFARRLEKEKEAKVAAEQAEQAPAGKRMRPRKGAAKEAPAAEEAPAVAEEVKEA